MKRRATTAQVEHIEAVLVAVRRVIRAVDLHSKRLLQHHGLTGPQLLLMRALAESGPESVGQLAERVRLSQATVTEILARLARAGLVDRQRHDGDRRRVINRLTAAGRRRLAAAPPPLQEAFGARFARMPAVEQQVMLAMLERLAEMMDAGDLDAAPLLSSGAATASAEALEAALSEETHAPGDGERGGAGKNRERARSYRRIESG